MFPIAVITRLSLLDPPVISGHLNYPHSLTLYPLQYALHLQHYRKHCLFRTTLPLYYADITTVTCLASFNIALILQHYRHHYHYITPGLQQHHRKYCYITALHTTDKHYRHYGNITDYICYIVLLTPLNYYQQLAVMHQMWVLVKMSICY